MGPASSDAEPTQRGHSAGAKVFGRYTLGEILGRGGMGVVWRARDAVLGEEVALKFLPDAVRWDPAAYEDLKDETRRARQLTHPNIVRIHDFVEDGGSAAISMELVDGATLTALRLAKPAKVLEVADVAAWLPQLCAALEYAHQEAKVVHRDLKPTNLMLTRDGRLKVADFGVARSMADSITRVSMMTAGTLVYMSPQQAMGEDPSPTDDVYAMGATVYEVLTGKPPFHTGDVRMQLFQRRPDAMTARRKSLGVQGEPIPAAWEAAVLACLAKEPADRPASAMDFLRWLQQPVAPRRRWWRAPTRRELGWGVPAMALAAMAVFVFTRPTPADSAPEGSFPSDATRAVGAWNFDGESLDDSGHGYHAVVSGAMPTADRFGRIDRALQFNGSASVLLPDVPALRWSGVQPMTAAVWVRHDDSPLRNCDVWRGMGREVGSFVWLLGFSEGRPHATVGRAQQEGYSVAMAAAPQAPGSWHHLALVKDGTTVALFVDGRPAASSPLGANATAVTPQQVDNRLGRSLPLSSYSLNGAIDDVRLWRRALTPAEIAALAGQNAGARIVRTRGAYVETDDFDAALREEFGAGARLLDWNDLKRQHADDAWGWAEDMSFAVSETLGLLQCGGQRLFGEKRHYFINRFNGRKPDYYMAHDEMGGFTLALGSWHEVRAPLFAVIPAPAPVTEKLVPDAADKIIRARRPIALSRSAVAISWRARLAATPGTAVTARLRLSDQRVLRAVCETTASATVALALGAAEGGGISRNVGGSFGEYDFTLVARERRLSFRAVSVVGRNPLFNELSRLDEFLLSDVVEIEVEAGPNSGLAAATLVIE